MFEHEQMSPHAMRIAPIVTPSQPSHIPPERQTLPLSQMDDLYPVFVERENTSLVGSGDVSTLFL
jgi:hypothetical protein